MKSLKTFDSSKVVFLKSETSPANLARLYTLCDKIFPVIGQDILRYFLCMFLYYGPHIKNDSDYMLYIFIYIFTYTAYFPFHK